MTATLTILGLPLSERSKPPEAAVKTLQAADFIIGESRKVSERYLKAAKVPQNVSVFFLDNIAPRDWKALQTHLKTLATKEGKVVLFSDMGMPILFDPGKDVLQECKKLGFKIRSVPGPTSWGTALALSGWEPPFLLIGFPPAKTEERRQALANWNKHAGHLVFMDTPYRFRALLEDAKEVFGAHRKVFLAWEIGAPEEELIWGTFETLLQEASRRGLQKGEFILLVEQKPL